MPRFAPRLAAFGLAFMLPLAAAAQEPGEWAHRAQLLEPNSEFAVAELDGRLYILGGYPASRETVTTVQIYDTATDTAPRSRTGRVTITANPPGRTTPNDPASIAPNAS